MLNVIELPKIVELNVLTVDATTAFMLESVNGTTVLIEER